MQKLNIAIVCDPLTYLTSGSMVSTWRFAECLKQRGHNVIFIAANDKKDMEHVSWCRGFRVFRFFSFALPGSNAQYIMSFPGVKQLRKIFADEKINIVHIIDPTWAAIRSIKAARKLGLKVVSHSHMQPENMSFQLPKIMRGRVFDSLVYKFMIWVYRKVDAVICPTKFAENMLRRYDKDIKIFVISNGVDLSRFRPMGSSRFMEKYSLPKSNKRLLYVGRLHNEKSVRTLIEAMPHILSRHKNTDLCIVGTGHLREALEAKAKELGVESNVKFLGRIPDEELAMAYNSCDIFVLPSIAELEGMVVLEAMACGKPIIISDSKASAASDFVRNNGFIFRLQNPEDLAEKALIILKDEKLMKKMGAQSLKQAREYDIEKSADKLEKVYESVLASG